jgi:hypothetical protein
MTYKINFCYSTVSLHVSHRDNVLLDSRRGCYAGLVEIAYLIFSWSPSKTCGFFTYIFPFDVPPQKKKKSHRDFNLAIADGTILNLRLILPSPSTELFAFRALAFTWMKWTYWLLHRSADRRRATDVTSQNVRNLSFCEKYASPVLPRALTTQ